MKKKKKKIFSDGFFSLFSLLSLHAQRAISVGVCYVGDFATLVHVDRSKKNRFCSSRSWVEPDSWYYPFWRAARDVCRWCNARVSPAPVPVPVAATPSSPATRPTTASAAAAGAAAAAAAAGAGATTCSASFTASAASGTTRLSTPTGAFKKPLARMISKGTGKGKGKGKGATATATAAPSLASLAEKASVLHLVVDFELFREQILRSPTLAGTLRHLAFGSGANNATIDVTDLRALVSEVERRAESLRSAINGLRANDRSVHVHVVVGSASQAKSALSTERRRPHVRTLKKRVGQLSGDQSQRERATALSDLATACAALSGSKVRDLMLSAFTAALGDGHVATFSSESGSTTTTATAVDIDSDGDVWQTFCGVVHPVGIDASLGLGPVPTSRVSPVTRTHPVGLGASSVGVVRSNDHADAAIAALALEHAKDPSSFVALVGADIDLPVLSVSGDDRDNRIAWCKSLQLDEAMSLASLLATVRDALPQPQSLRTMDNATLARSLRVASVLTGDDFVARAPVHSLDGSKQRRPSFAKTLAFVARHCPRPQQLNGSSPFLNDTAAVLHLCDKCKSSDNATDECVCTVCVARAAVSARGAAHARAAAIPKIATVARIDVESLCQTTAGSQQPLLLEALSRDFGFSQLFWDRVARRRQHRRFGVAVATEDDELVAAALRAAALDAVAVAIEPFFLAEVDVLPTPEPAPRRLQVDVQASRLPTLRSACPLVIPLVNVTQAQVAVAVKVRKSAAPVLPAKATDKASKKRTAAAATTTTTTTAAPAPHGASTPIANASPDFREKAAQRRSNSKSERRRRRRETLQRLSQMNEPPS
jgi:hypothetical protein